MEERFPQEMLKMITSIKNFLAPPVFDDDDAKTRKAALLSTILLASFALASLYLVALPIFFPQENPLWALIRYPLIVSTWVLLRGRKIRAACILFVVGMWVIQMFVWGGSAGLQPVSIAGVIIRIMITGLLLGGRMAFLFAGLSLLQNALIIYAISRGLLPPYPTRYTMPEILIEQGVWSCITAVLLSLWMSSLNQALRRAHDELAERKRAEMALRATEERFSKAFNASPMPMAIHSLPDVRFIDVNDAFVRYGEYTREQVIGRAWSELNTWVDPKEKEQIWRALQDLNGRVRNMEAKFRCKGSEVRVGIFSSEVITLDGKECLLSVLNDITERKQAEAIEAQFQEAIRMSALEWRRTFDSIESVLMILNLEGKIIRLNRAAKALSRLSYKLSIGRTVESIGNGQPWQEAAAVAKLIRENGRTVSSQTQDQLSGKVWEINATMLSGIDNRLIIVARDITEMVKLQESLRRSETMSAMGALVAGVAHEARNPLFSISATLDAFEARFSAQDAYQQYLNNLRRELKRLNDLMSDLLEYGKPFSLELTQGAISEVVAKAIRSCDALVKGSNIKIESRVDPDLAPILMDRRRVVQVFRNVIENAIQHSVSGAVVTVEAEQIRRGGARWIHCRIGDRGPGFRAEELSKIFEPFFTRRRGGTGIGLSIVQRIMEEHGGKVWASNRPDGGGVVELQFQAAEP